MTDAAAVHPLIVCMVPGPTEVLRTEPAGDRWCFRCRKRYPHTWELMTDKEPSYYDPVWVCRCSHCDEDHTAFPT